MRKVMKVIRFTVAVIIVLPFFLLDFIIGIPVGNLLWAMKKDKAHDKWIYCCIKPLANWVMFCFGGNLHVLGRENILGKSGKHCYVGNHSSMLDIVVMMCPKELWCGFIGKIEVSKMPVVSSWFRQVKAVYIDRDNPREAVKAILQGAKQISEGYPMCIFPEGTRSKDGEVHEFHAGSFKMATRAKAKIIPVVIKGTRRIFEEGDTFIRHPVYVQFLPAIDTAEMSDEECRNIHTIVENEIREAYAKLPDSRKKKK